MNLVPEVLIEDETLRDGLQNEQRVFSIPEKIELIRGLEAAGVRRIQVGSFVHPKWVQMANTDVLLHALDRRSDVTYTALVLNMKGIDRAIACDVRHLSMSISASETHNQRNANRSLAFARGEIAPMIQRARSEGIAVRAGIMAAFGCAYEGKIDPAVVVDIAAMYGELGADEINLADSTGMGNPKAVTDLVRRVRAVVDPRVKLSLHLRDTRGLGLANMVAGLQAGVAIYDAALGGLGGCPFIPVAAGKISTDAMYAVGEMGGVADVIAGANVGVRVDDATLGAPGRNPFAPNAARNIATEDAAYAMEEMGIATGIDWKKVTSLTLGLEEKLGQTLRSVMARLQAAPRDRQGASVR